MPSVITMPAFSSTMESGKLVQWLVNEGDKVKSGQPIAEVETDKAIAEIEATADGSLARILVSDPDVEIAINSTIGIILLEGESEDALSDFDANRQAGISEVETASKEAEKNKAGNSDEEPIQTSPGARRVAKEAGLDITLVTGTGPKGRITKTDVLEHIAGKLKQASSDDDSTLSNNDIQPLSTEHITPVSPIRNAIAMRLLESKRNIPHYYLEINITLDKLLELKSSLSKTSTLSSLSLNIFFMKAAALAMKNIPAINTKWMNDKIVQNSYCNIGVAVAIDDGLIVPVVCDVNNKELALVDEEIKELIKLARDGKLPQSKMGNASLTISNLGMYSIEKFFAIINPPESCILALGTTQKKPVVVNDNIVIRSVMTCCMSADHRLVDGAIAAQFLSKFKTLLENPNSMLV